MTFGCELPAVFEATERVARKRHACCECRRPIEPGDRYVENAGLWEGQWSHYRQHLRCARAFRAIEAELETGDYLAFGGLREALQERNGWRKRWSR